MNQTVFALPTGVLAALMLTLALPVAAAPGATIPQPKVIKAYDLDFNWGPGGPNGFAKPGLWADADPAKHVAWYRALGVNVIQTFCVSCNGYAWYKQGVVPEQPGLKHDFLREVVKGAHREGMLVLGYFCAGSNTRWGQEHPDLSYGTPSEPHLPYTDEYLTYLDAAVRDAVGKTGIDGFMVDWLRMPTTRASNGGRWLDCEKKLYAQLMDEPFPGETNLPAAKLTEYGRRAVDRCWGVIRRAARETNPDCLVWLTCCDVNDPHIANSRALKETDWLLNEAGDLQRTADAKRMIGPQTRLITCLANWNKQDPMQIVPAALKEGTGLYGFTKPGADSLVPLESLLSRPLGELKGDERNIAVLARVFHGASLESVRTADGRFVEPHANFRGRWVEGEGDEVALEAINSAFESTQPSARMACLPLLYKRDWDGLVEGPPWPCWWIQNSFGPSYALMPFLGEPYATWLEHSQGLWFRLMGDGQRKDLNGFQGPDGCLCDAAFVMMNGGSALGFGDFRRPGGAVGQQLDGKIHQEGIWYRQGDGNPKQHDWFIGATAGGLILEAERLLVRHEPAAARQRLAELERVAAFLDSRRDARADLLKGGMAANLLAPSYSGVRQPDGTFGQAYLAELSVNYVAGLERLAEVCVLCGEPAKAERYRATAAKVRRALPRLLTSEGCFVMSEDPDGTRHGVFGAAKHGYFEATPNHDAGCFGVTDDAANRKIVERMLTLKGTAAPGGFAPHGLIIPNYPGYDDSVHGGPYGHWVNGGHWTTTQARMSIACLRADEFAHPFGAWARIRALMEGYRADAPLTGFGKTPWGDKLQAPYCVVYDCWGASGGLLRGLFEYDYRADRLRVRPHLPANMTRYVQKFPVWFGKTKIYLTVTGTGAADWTELRPTGQPGVLAVEIVRGDAKRQGAWQPADAPAVEFPDAIAAMPVPTGSGNGNPLRIGASPNGGYNFNGEFREVGIYRRVLTGAEIKALTEGEAVAGALVSVPPPPNAPPQLVARRGEKFLELPSSADVDFQEDFTLAASIKPDTLADSARLIDRTTVGTMDGYLLDYLQGGKVLRLLTPWGIVQGPVNLQAGQWQHVAATCTASGLMRVYLNGAMVAEALGRKPVTPPALEATVDFRKLAAFHRALVKAGLQDTYEASMARTALQMLVARQARLDQPLPPPALEAIPPCNPQAVDTLYFNTASWIAGGLLDRLAGRSLRREPVTPGILDAARECGLLGEHAGSGDKITDWNGFKRLHFSLAGKPCFITQPALAAPGRPWVWRTSFPDFHAEVDLELLRHGWAIGYVECLDLLGCDAALDLMDQFYAELTERRGFARRPALEAVSRGGLHAYRYAARHPDRIACIYADTPVMDLKSWPLGWPGAKKETAEALKFYAFKDQAELRAYRGNPVDVLEPIAKEKLPLRHVISLSDRVVPPEQNTLEAQRRLQTLGHSMDLVTVREGTAASSGHHFPLPEVFASARFIMTHTTVLPTGREYSAVRDGLANSRAKFEGEKTGRVAFLGGSITFNPGWRDAVMRYLQQRFPETKFDFIAAGIPSLGSVPHAFRLETDVLARGPLDLLFVEAAVNDHNYDSQTNAAALALRGMEGVVRHVRRVSPQTDIVELHFVHDQHLKTWAGGNEPYTVAAHERVAEHYGCPSVNLSREVSERIAAGQFTWAGDFRDLHPSPYGQQLYALSITRLLDAAWQAPAPGTKPHPLPPPLDPASYERGRFGDVKTARILSGFTLDPSWQPADGKEARAGYVKVPALVATTPGAEFAFALEGTGVGLMITSGPDARTIAFRVDDRPEQTVSTVTPWSRSLHLPWALMLADDLPPGQHTVRIRLVDGALRVFHLLEN